MSKLYRVSRTGLRLFYKIRHHRGHGIHSPFVYNLVTRVIEEKLPYYDYHTIRDAVHNHPEIGKKVNKYDLLSFRLANEFMPQRILELGTGEGINALCLTSPVSKSSCVCVESTAKAQLAEGLFQNWDRNILLQAEFIPLDKKVDCVYINLKNYPVDFSWVQQHILPHLHENSFVIIRGIRTKKEYNLLWKSMIALQQVSLSLDLYHVGVLFFKDRLYKQSFKISF